MEISYNWLRQYVPLNHDAEEVSKILTAIGLEIEDLTVQGKVQGGLKGLIVGEVLTCEKHPNADRLHVTTVNVGADQPLRIVCGAPNVAVGLKVVVAPVGTELHSVSGETMTIKRAKIRGEESEGMLCAEDEIGVGTSHDGIIELAKEAKVGTPVALQYPELLDYVFSIGITANRADALSHYGVARDIAAYLNQKVPTRAKLPTINLPLGEELDRIPYGATGGKADRAREKSTVEKSATQVDFGSVDSKGCIRYAGLTIRGVTIKESPSWIAERLMAVGLKPICNVVDITNFVMLELGQPLHAFDLKAFPSRRVSVKFPAKGTVFTTLDGQERTLSGNDLAICHDDTPLCLAGVFGGKDSGISETTTDLFLESAVFDPVVVRKTARGFGLQTDASYHFERGVDPAFTITALRRAAELILETAGGSIDGNIIDTYPRPLEHDPIIFDSQRANILMGVSLSRRELETLFEGLEIDYRPIGAGKYELKVPYYRVDVTHMEDVAEDLLRLYGYDRVPISNKMSVALDREARSAIAQHERTVRLMLVGAGFHEIMCNSLNSSEDYNEQLTYEGRHIVKIMNPRSGDLNVLRPTLLLGGLDAIARNISRQRTNLKLCEFGHCYTYEEEGKKTNDPLFGYTENPRLGLWLCGSNAEGVWNDVKQPYDTYHLKGYCETILHQAGIDLRSVYYRETSGGFLSSAATISLGKKGNDLCRFGEVDENLLMRYEIKQPVFFAEIEWGAIAALWEKKHIGFEELPQFPEVRRDLALLLDKRVAYAQVEHVARRTAGSLLKRMALFDVYEGDKIPEGKKSYAVKFILQNERATLDDVTIDGCMQRLADAFAKELGATLRS